MRLQTSTSMCSLFIAIMAHAQTDNYWGEDQDSLLNRPEYAASIAECRRVRDVTPPLAERITAPAHDQLSECDAEQLYYGIGIPPEPEQARACALRRLDANPDPFDGAGLLTMIHANGRGGQRDLDLAIHFPCRMGGAPAEMAGRIERLMRITGQPLDDRLAAFGFDDRGNAVSDDFSCRHHSAHHAFEYLLIVPANKLRRRRHRLASW